MNDPMSSKTMVMGAIRRSLGVRGDEDSRLRAVEERIRTTPRGPALESRMFSNEVERLSFFMDKVVASAAEVRRLADLSAVPEAVALHLTKLGYDQSVRLSDPRFLDLAWGVHGVEAQQGIERSGYTASVSFADLGIAETGTLVLTSSASNPTTLNFLPELHVIVVAQQDIVSIYEEAWDRLRSTYGSGVMPRTVNWVTGPSRSADIEQTLILGAHGPRAVLVLIVDQASASTGFPTKRKGKKSV
jgi:L-lactate dehydrogenase complex protein LldG